MKKRKAFKISVRQSPLLFPRSSPTRSPTGALGPSLQPQLMPNSTQKAPTLSPLGNVCLRFFSSLVCNPPCHLVLQGSSRLPPDATWADMDMEIQFCPEEMQKSLLVVLFCQQALPLTAKSSMSTLNVYHHPLGLNPFRALPFYILVPLPRPQTFCLLHVFSNVPLPPEPNGSQVPISLSPSRL